MINCGRGEQSGRRFLGTSIPKNSKYIICVGPTVQSNMWESSACVDRKAIIGNIRDSRDTTISIVSFVVA